MPLFTRAFSHLELSPGDQVDHHIYFVEGESSEVSSLERPWVGEKPHHLGLIESFTEDHAFLLEQPGSLAIYCQNRNAGKTYYWIEDIDQIPVWESDFPLRMVFHWWFKNTGLQPTHAGAVGIENKGLLLVGAGGSGKSTSCLACINSQLRFAGDDYVLLDTQNRQVFSLFSLSKVTDKSIGLLENIHIDRSTLAKPIDDKYRIHLYPNYKESLIRSFPVFATLVPKVEGGSKTSIVPCSKGEAMRAIAPTTLFQLPGLREESFAKISKFIRTTPTYTLNLGPDTSNLPTLLSSFLDNF
ncbi:hypothetical protein [Ekhidna sp.]|uniref:hypothetical protein n=1 Tax=Ekhidna sp. TaxID=2608089 RepID=UPI003B58C0CE